MTYLRTEHKGRFGRPLAPKTVHHQYNTLNLIFSYAEKQEIIAKNPMHKVDAPKKKKPVDALSKEQAQHFFSVLPREPLDFRCMLLLFITTGLRRGGLYGLQWGDLGSANRTVTVQRNVAYTPEFGLAVGTPKTANSIRMIPIMDSTLVLLRQYQKQVQKEHRNTILKDAYIFPSQGADLKSVQEILGHADASTTLNFYVKADLQQMQAATDKYAAAFNL